MSVEKKHDSDTVSTSSLDPSDESKKHCQRNLLSSCMSVFSFEKIEQAVEKGSKFVQRGSKVMLENCQYSSGSVRLGKLGRLVSNFNNEIKTETFNFGDSDTASGAYIMFYWKTPHAMVETSMYCCRKSGHHFVIEYSDHIDGPFTPVTRHTQSSGWTTSHWDNRGAHTHWRYRLTTKQTTQNPPVWYSCVEWFEDNDLSQQISLSSTIARHFNSIESSDFMFVVENKEIRVHKTILSLRSEYLAKMLNGSWKESQSNKIVTDKYSYKVYYAFLRFLYTDAISHDMDAMELVELMDLARSDFQYKLYSLALNAVVLQIDVDNIIPIAKRAKELKLDYVFDRCDQAVSHSVTLRIDSVFSSLKIAVELGLDQLRKHCIKFLKENPGKVLFSTEFLSHMESQEFRNLLKSII